MQEAIGISRRRLLGLGLSGALGAAAAAALPARVLADEGQESAQLGEIYQLQAAFHRAKTTQDIDLMMSLWAQRASLQVVGDARSPFAGAAQLRNFWLGSGSFVNRRFSLVPSYKIQIRIDDSEAYLYFECHDVGNYDQSTRFIAADTFLAGTLRRTRDRWLFWDMTAGKASPLSVDHYYFP